MLWLAARLRMCRGTFCCAQRVPCVPRAMRDIARSSRDRLSQNSTMFRSANRGNSQHFVHSSFVQDKKQNLAKRHHKNLKPGFRAWNLTGCKYVLPLLPVGAIYDRWKSYLLGVTVSLPPRDTAPRSAMTFSRLRAAAASPASVSASVSRQRDAVSLPAPHSSLLIHETPARRNMQIHAPRQM